MIGFVGHGDAGLRALRGPWWSWLAVAGLPIAALGGSAQGFVGGGTSNVT